MKILMDALGKLSLISLGAAIGYLFRGELNTAMWLVVASVLFETLLNRARDVVN